MLALVAVLLVIAYFGGNEDVQRLVLGEEKVSAVPTEQEELQQEVDDASIPATGKPVRFLMLNTENYFVAGERQRSPYTYQPKSKEACEAVADVIASVKPEIVGLVEIGGPLALADLRRRLAARGLAYSYFRVLTREGEDRALALLSRHPIVHDDSRANQPLLDNERSRPMLRGILDVTVKLKDGRMFRVIGAHLKSRVTDDPAKARNLRSREATTIAMRVRDIARSQPRMPVVVYGDWNDGPSDSSLGVLTEGVSRNSALTRLTPADSNGEKWTLFYKGDRTYYTFDQVYVNSVLKKRMGGKSKQGVVNHPSAGKASDHRAVWCDLY